MLLRLAEHLEVPLRERNRLLVTAGYAPPFEQHHSTIRITPVREALGPILAAHDPYPAVVVDVVWEMIAANGGFAVQLSGRTGIGLAPWRA